MWALNKETLGHAWELTVKRNKPKTLRTIVKEKSGWKQQGELIKRQRQAGYVGFRKKGKHSTNQQRQHPGQSSTQDWKSKAIYATNYGFCYFRLGKFSVARCHSVITSLHTEAFYCWWQMEGFARKQCGQSGAFSSHSHRPCVIQGWKTSQPVSGRLRVSIGWPKLSLLPLG